MSFPPSFGGFGNGFLWQGGGAGGYSASTTPHRPTPFAPPQGSSYASATHQRQTQHQPTQQRHTPLPETHQHQTQHQPTQQRHTPLPATHQRHTQQPTTQQSYTPLPATQQRHTQQPTTQQRQTTVGCAACGRAFESESLLEEHVGAEHLGWRPLVCAHCPADFVNQRRLREHFAVCHPNMLLASKRRRDTVRESEMQALMDRSLGRQLSAAAHYANSRTSTTGGHPTGFQNAFQLAGDSTPIAVTPDFKFIAPIPKSQQPPTVAQSSKSRSSGDFLPLATEIKSEESDSFTTSTPILNRKRQATSTAEHAPEPITKQHRGAPSPSTTATPSSSVLGTPRGDLLLCRLCGWSSSRGGEYIRVHVFSHVAKETGRKRFGCGAAGCGFASTASSAVAQHQKRSHSSQADVITCVDRSSELREEFEGLAKRCFGQQELADFPSQAEAAGDGKQPSRTGGAGGNRVVCELCKVAIARTTLSAHVNRFHLTRPFYYCPECPFEGRNSDHVKDHMKKVHNSMETPMNRQNDDGLGKERAKWYKQCFPKLDISMMHSASMRQDLGSKCNLCNNVDVALKKRNNHMLTKHLRVELFKCPLCDFAHTANRADVQHHVERAHEKAADVAAIDLKDCYKQQIADMYRECFEIRQSEDENAATNALAHETPVPERLPTAQSNSCLLCGAEVLRNDHAVHLLHCQMDLQRFQCLQCKFAHGTDPLLVRKHMLEAHNLPDKLPFDCLHNKFEELREMIRDAFPPAVRSAARPVATAGSCPATRSSGSALTHTCNLCGVVAEKRAHHAEAHHLKIALLRCAFCSYSCSLGGKREMARHLANKHNQDDLSNAFSLAGCFTKRVQDVYARCFERTDDDSPPLNGSEAPTADSALPGELKRLKLPVESQNDCPLCFEQITANSHQAHFLRAHLKLGRFQCRQCEFASDSDPMLVVDHMKQLHATEEEVAPLDMMFERASEINQMMYEAFPVRQIVARVHDAAAWFELTIGDRFILRALDILCRLIVATGQILLNPAEKKVIALLPVD